jgi:DmsE family decaheme c-type cytochrome
MLWPPLLSPKRRLAAALLPVAGAVAAFLLCQPAGAQAPAPAAPAPSTQAPAAPAYAGSETCGTCHEDIYNAFQKNPHKLVDTQKRRGFEGKACEACHGPGGKHAESADKADIVNPARLPAAQTERTCLKCHLNQPTHIGHIQSSHARNQVSCTACHAIHRNGPNGLVPRRAAAVNEQCASCHMAIWAQFQRPFKHRLPEGAMSCVDCHNPHGSIFRANAQSYAANEPGCFRCHGNLRGPFTFEHAPMRLEGCTACHEPHGSANPRMLVRQEVRYVCLECHSNMPTAPGPINKPPALGGVPPAFHDLLSPQFRNCTVCHVKIHGSYISRELLK